jgi:hypothetical protein
MIFPAFQWQNGRARLTIGQRMAREHSSWLTRILRGRAAMPRIPVRRISEGGFAQLMSTPSGRARAERWWERTLERVED